jgi:NAD(P)H dehydrogenase (quinone)
VPAVRPYEGHRYVSPEEQTATLVAAGVAASFAEILVDVDLAITRGALAATPGDLSRLIGRPTTPLADTIAAALTAQHGAATA